MQHHSLKIWPRYYQAVKEGIKTFEVRKNDRNFKTADTVSLGQFDPETKEFVGTEILIFRIGYVLPIDEERVVFSLLPITKDEKSP